MFSDITVGVLALQGAFSKHVEMLERCGAQGLTVRDQSALEKCDALVIPGGESTSIRFGLHRSGLLDPLRSFVLKGMPVLGTCAGMIVLAKCRPDAAPSPLGLLDIEVDRNGWGSQIHSTQWLVDYQLKEATPRVVPFIRAPRIVRLGPNVEVLATLAEGANVGEVVAVQQENLVACAFHPELCEDKTLHNLLIALAAKRK